MFEMHCVPYSQYLNFLKQKNQLENILIIKHDSCITLGKNSHEREILNKTNLPIYKSNRAGGATYHDQGQLVLYPYINIKKRDINITEYIHLLEAWGVSALQEIGVHAIKGVQPGLWVMDKNERAKIAFIGLAMHSGFMEHGISFNLIDCDLENFKTIIPCNSFEKIGKINVGFDEFAKAIEKHNPFDINIQKSLF